MEAAFAELPLALFSTLAPVGAGAFTLLAIALCSGRLDDAQLKRIDRFTAIPVVFVLVGFVAAFFHLASPAHAVGVFSNLGASPLSNEVAMGCLFVAVMLVYWVWALTGKMAPSARKAMVAATAVVGLVFALFTGLAYTMDTIASWNSIGTPLQMLGYALLGGGAMAVLVLALAGCADALKSGSLKTGVVAVAVVGLVLGLGGFAWQAVAATGMSNALYNGADLVGGAMVAIICGAVCLVASGACETFAVRGSGAASLVGIGAGAVVLAVVGILLLRLAFYAMQLSVGLSVL